MSVLPFLAFFALLVASLYLIGAFHIIQTGHIGVYKRGGALLNTWTEPGLHFMMPLITHYSEVQVTLQTDEVRNIPCGTSSGVMIQFSKIEVVNRLKKEYAHETIKNYTVTYDQTWIFSKIHHEINQFCSSHSLQEVLIEKFNILDQSLKKALEDGCKEWAPGIQIIAVRVTKPTVPESIAKTYEAREVERTNLLIKRQEQRLKQKEAEIAKRVSKIEAETLSLIANITNEMDLAQKKAQQKINAIKNQIIVIEEAAHARANKYRIRKLVELNELRLIPGKQLETMLTNLKRAQKTVYVSNLQKYLSSAASLLKMVGIGAEK